MAPLQNLYSFRADMRATGWTIDSFCFPFKGEEYIVLVILYLPGEPKEKYALLKLEFIRPDGWHLTVPANSVRLIYDEEILRRYSNLPKEEYPGDALSSMLRQLGHSIPQQVNTHKSKKETREILSKVCNSTSAEDDKLYCFAVKRNPVIIDEKTNEPRQLKRTAYNDQKTRSLRNSLYQKLGKDDTLSFCYSDDPEMDYPDKVIIENWAKNKNDGKVLLPV